MITAGSWKDLNKENQVLSAETINVLKKIGFPSMTPVQKSVTPYLLGYKDVAVEAITGSGKTLAYLVPSMEYIKKSAEGVAVVVLVPTHELAKQVFEVATKISTEFPQMIPQYVIGGSKVTEDIEAFNKIKPTLIIGTPGKLHELMVELPEATFRKMSLFVIDEADQILKMGLGGTLTSIFQKLPTQRRTGLFSATMNDALNEIIRTGMRNPMYVRVKSNDAQTPAELVNFYAIVDDKYKFCQLIEFIRTNLMDAKCILFVLNRQEVDFMFQTIKIALGENCPQIFPIYGRMTPKERSESIEAFRKVKKGIMLATDVMARGIDMPDIDWIIQFDAPPDYTMFVHRVGRTARIGRSGNAIIFLRDHEDCYIDYLKNTSDVIDMTEMKIPVPEDAEDILKRIRTAVSQSEEFYITSMKCVVAYVRSYSGYALELIFRLKELDFIALSEGFGLIRIPGMTEIRDRNIKQPGYLDKVNEWNKLHEEEWKPFAEKAYSMKDFGAAPEKKKDNNKKGKDNNKKGKDSKDKKAPPKHVQKPQSHAFHRMKK